MIFHFIYSMRCQLLPKTPASGAETNEGTTVLSTTEKGQNRAIGTAAESGRQRCYKEHKQTATLLIPSVGTECKG